MTHQLTCDKFSFCKGKEQYGKAGDKVRVISQSGHVLIVENAKKNRYAVQETEIKLITS